MYKIKLPSCLESAANQWGIYTDALAITQSPYSQNRVNRAWYVIARVASGRPDGAALDDSQQIYNTMKCKSLALSVSFISVFDGLHQFVKLAELLICSSRILAHIRTRNRKENNSPLILSNLALSSLSPTQVSPSSFCA